MISPARTAALVSFRDADAPRALAGPLLAAAHSHARGWTLSVPGAPGATEHVTFDGVAREVLRATGVTRLLIVWTVGEHPGRP